MPLSSSAWWHVDTRKYDFTSFWVVQAEKDAKKKAKAKELKKLRKEKEKKAQVHNIFLICSSFLMLMGIIFILATWF